jgi:hypothetical protein
VVLWSLLGLYGAGMGLRASSLGRHPLPGVLASVKFGRSSRSPRRGFSVIAGSRLVGIVRHVVGLVSLGGASVGSAVSSSAGVAIVGCVLAVIGRWCSRFENISPIPVVGCGMIAPGGHAVVLSGGRCWS